MGERIWQGKKLVPKKTYNILAYTLQNGRIALNIVLADRWVEPWVR